MQTLKNHFNYKARQRNIDLIILYMLLVLLIAKHNQLKSDIAYLNRKLPPCLPSPLTRAAAPGEPEPPQPKIYHILTVPWYHGLGARCEKL